MEVMTNDPVHVGARDYIISNAKYHSDLLRTISELDYVPQAKKDQIQYIKDLENQIKVGVRKVEELAQKTTKERKEHESLRDSTARRFAHKMVGKKNDFAERASKEEREYVEALERELTERDHQNTRIKMLDDGKQALEDLKQNLTRYESAQAELQALYNRAFEGPTPDFPEEDPLEYEFNAANDAHQTAQAAVNAESRAGELLTKAVRSMEECAANMSDALSYSRFDMWGGGSMSDMMERSALRNATVNAGQARNLSDQATRVSPHVRPIPPVRIAEGSILSDVFFDNIFTDMAFHDKIKQSALQVAAALDTLRREKNAAWRRLDEAGNALMRAAERLENGRRELDAYRHAVFESIVAQDPPPPNYSAPNTPEISADNPSQIDSSTPDMLATRGDQASVSSTADGPTMPKPQPPGWGNRNPFAYALSEHRGDVETSTGKN